MTQDEARIKILKVLFLGQLTLEANDDLESTPFYKQKLKYAVKNANKEIEKQVTPQLKNVIDADPEFATNMFNQVDDMISKIAGLQIDEFPMINKLLDEYIKDPKYWKEHLVLEFNKVKV